MKEVNEIIKLSLFGVLAALASIIAWIGIEMKNDMKSISISIIELNQKMAVVVTKQMVDADVLIKHDKQLETLIERVHNLEIRGN